MKVQLVYIAGPYRNPDPWNLEQNIRNAEALAHKVALLGAYPCCPHSNTRPYFNSAYSDEFVLAATLELMRRCDAVMCLSTWKKSSGARQERAEAERIGLPVFDQWEIGLIFNGQPIWDGDNRFHNWLRRAA